MASCGIAWIQTDAAKAQRITRATYLRSFVQNLAVAKGERGLEAVLRRLDVTVGSSWEEIGRRSKHSFMQICLTIIHCVLPRTTRLSHGVSIGDTSERVYLTAMGTLLQQLLTGHTSF